MAVDPALASNLAGLIFIVGGIFLTLGLRWYFLKEGGMKFNGPVMTMGIIEMVLGIVIALAV